MNITIDLIKQLRDQSGVSISACKKALEEAAGDLDAAFDLLRKKGEAKAKERSERTTSEGVVSIVKDGSKAAAITIACETDFVSKNEDFINTVKDFANQVLSGTEIADAEISDLGLKMGENVVLKSSETLDGNVLGTYVHSNNKLGAVAILEGGNEEIAKQIAMHVTATSPKALNKSDVDQVYIDKELAFAKEELASSNKPESIWDKILTGKESKLRSDVALNSQSFVMNPDQTIEEFAAANNAKVTGFRLYKI